MYLRSSSQRTLPVEPVFPPSLAALGYEIVNDRVVREGRPGEYFDFLLTDNERVNLLHKEAVQSAIRHVVLDRLSEFGLETSYLYEGRMKSSKPEVAHVNVLHTEVSLLSSRKDVVVVIGEQTQDLGIWAWRLVLGEEGISGGSATGLASMLQAYENSQSKFPGENRGDAVGDADKLGWTSIAGTDAETTGIGLIVLNPGQLLYSPLENRPMTFRSWAARRKCHVHCEEFEINHVHNRVYGHRNAQEHVRTFFDQILPQITREDVRLYVVGISDGADTFLNYLDSEFGTSPDSPIASKLEAVALIQPNYEPKCVCSESLRIFLATNSARAWVISDHPKGELVNTAAPFRPNNFEVITPDCGFVNADGHNSEDATPDTDKGTLPPGALHDISTSVGGDDKPPNAEREEHALCATFSSGVVDVIETVWPNVMRDVLSYFSERQQAADQREHEIEESIAEPVIVEEADSEGEDSVSDDYSDEDYGYAGSSCSSTDMTDVMYGL